MKNIKIYLIAGSIIAFISLIWFGLYQYKCKIQLEQSLREAQHTIQVQQTYIEEKDKAIKEIEKKYREQLAKKPNDLCGDSLVPDNIKNWLLGEDND
jgi:cell division protein FtsL